MGGIANHKHATRNIMQKIEYMSNRSLELFEVNEGFMQIAKQLPSDMQREMLDKVITDLTNEIDPAQLFSNRLKTVCMSIGAMNKVVDRGDAYKMVKLAEVLQTHGIEMLGKHVADTPNIKAVLIAGPSSSGKTTFSKKLNKGLEKYGISAQCISLDDYYVDRELTPKDENGEYDFESIYAINIDQFQSDITDLLNGKEIELPKYEFRLGKSIKSGKRISLSENTVLIIEGIHGLNPLLTQRLPADRLFRIYISGLTVAKNDDGTYFPTTDNRLIRRMVRDSQFRNTPASSTLARWASVRHGENKWVVPFQQNADANFCTAFQYELAILKRQALPLLEDVPQDDPYYLEAQRLKWVLERFHDISADMLPKDSLLREFVGGSAFEY